MANKLTDRDRDVIVRTIIGEAGSEPPLGQAAVANVILNRLAAGYAPNASGVAFAPRQFEPWQTRGAELASISPRSQAYQSANAVLDAVLSGRVPDPTGGATHFLNENIVRQRRGGSLPQWAQAPVAKIGGHTFYAPQGAVEANLATAVNRSNKDNRAEMPKPSDDDALLRSFGINTGGKSVAAEAPQADEGEALFKSFAVEPAKTEDTFVDPSIAKRQELKDFAYGVARGGKDVLDTLAHGLANATSYGADFLAKQGVIPQDAAKSVAQSRDETLAADKAGRDQFSEQYGENAAADWGRIGGQVAGSLPVMSVGTAALAPVAGPAGAAVLQAAKGNRLLSAMARLGIGSGIGAGMGATGNALTSSASDEPTLDQMKTGAILGGAVGAAAPVVAGGARWLGKTARGLAEPFTDAGQNRIADRVIQEFAGSGPTTPKMAQFVPGSQPTLAQATANPGLATLERAVRDVRPNEFGQRAAQNAQAREMAIDALRGDKVSMKALMDMRDAEAGALRSSAFKGSKPVDPQSVVDKIDNILASPSGQRDAVKNALTAVRDKIARKDDAGNLLLQNDPAQLYGIRQAISDMTSPLSEAASKGARLASSELGDVTKTLDKVIEQGAPGYRAYMDKFSQMSKPIDTQKLLQDLNITDSKGNVTLGKIDSALKRIEKARNARGLNDAKSIPDPVLKALYAVRDDLQREGNSALGKSVGSNTFQNLATNSLMNRIGAPLAALEFMRGHNPLVSMGLGAGRMIYGSQNEAILNRLTEKLLNPAAGASAFSAPLRVNVPVPVRVPAAAVVGTNRLMRDYAPASDR